MRTPILTFLSLAGLLAGVLFVAGPAQAGPSDPMVGAPAVGTCYDLTIDEVYARSIHADPVDCAQSHTVAVVAVQQLPDGVAYEPRKADFVSRVMKTCFPSLNSALGVTAKQRHYTNFKGAWFIPTAAERDQGARWFSCETVMYAGSKKVVPIPESLDIGDPPYDASIAGCLTEDGYATTCSRNHAFGKVVVLRVKDAKYPTDREWYRMGLNRCDNVVSHPRRGYRWTWPSKDAWKFSDDHYLSCYSATTS